MHVGNSFADFQRPASNWPGVVCTLQLRWLSYGDLADCSPKQIGSLLILQRENFDDVLSLCADIRKILRLCCDADWSLLAGRALSETDPVFLLLAQNVVHYFFLNEKWRSTFELSASVNTAKALIWCLEWYLSYEGIQGTCLQLSLLQYNIYY